MKGISDKICTICGAPNAFYNYGAISCRACGAFFRRYVLLGSNFGCICKNGIENNLIFTIGCKYCRLKKCIQNGMKKELVRSANLQNFHRERRQLMERKKGELEISTLSNLDQIKFNEANIRLENFIQNQFEHFEAPKSIQMLLGLFEKAAKFRKSIKLLPMEFFEPFDSLESLLHGNKNILSDNYQLKKKIIRAIITNYSTDMKEILQNGIFNGVIPMSATELWVFANFARAMPIFNRLQFADQVTLLTNSTLASVLLAGNFASAKRNSQTMVRYDGICVFSIFANQYSDPILTNAAANIFHIPTREFMRVDLAVDEFTLLMALLFSNAAIPGLSPQGQQILKGEEEKYGKMLLGLQQRRFGENAGALRYMETLRLLWTTIRQMQKHHEIFVYIDSLYEHGKYEKIMPKALFPMLISQQNL